MLTKHNGTIRFTTTQSITIYCATCPDCYSLVYKDITMTMLANITNVAKEARKDGWKVKTGHGNYAYCPICKLNHKKAPNE